MWINKPRDKNNCISKLDFKITSPCDFDTIRFHFIWCIQFLYLCVNIDKNKFTAKCIYHMTDMFRNIVYVLL